MAALSTSSMFAKELATDVFDATATTGVGTSSPIDVDPNHVTMRADGAIGFGYTYRASGEAYGEVPGSVGYEEHGFLFFRNPADPTTFAGSRYDSGVFSLKPTRRPGETITIADTDPAAYQSATRVLALPGVDPLLGKYTTLLLNRLNLVPVAGAIRYGVFTFTDQNGTFWGVSTPDSRHFLLGLRFSPDPDETRGQPSSETKPTGSDVHPSARFGHPRMPGGGR
ncbi:MAG: hypothetical protein ACR2IK_13490 [Chloroflexota bacterium]